MGNASAALRVLRKFDAPPPEHVARRRHLVAQMCRLLVSQVGDDTGRPAAPADVPSSPGGNGRASAVAAQPAGDGSADTPGPHLSPRMRQTLERLLAGDSEKQAAQRLRVSQHTVHVYVKNLYRRFGVCSRGELFARFVRAGAAVTTTAPAAVSDAH